MAALARSALPGVRGALGERAPLADFVWFRVGGPAEILFRPADLGDLCAFLVAKPRDLPIMAIGVGSNVLVRDGGIRGVVIRLGSTFGRVVIEPGHRVRAGAACLDATVARSAADAGIAGLEFLRGIPGTIGGALRMNAGCYGSEIKDVLVEARAVDASGKSVTFTNAEMGFSYRKASVPDDLVFVDAVFQGRPDDTAAVRVRMEDLVAAREKTQPIRSRTGGSTFKNPEGGKAWQLIDAAGCRGLRIGGAQVSEMHCNFLINTGGATAADIETLGEEVRARVKQTSGVELEWEIKRVGVANKEGTP